MSNELAVRQTSLKAELERQLPALQAIVPKHVTPARLIKVALSATNRDSKILKCSGPSIVRSIFQAAELGLEIGGLLGEAYLVPFKRKWRDDHGQWHEEMQAQCITGYKGLIKLARQSGQITALYAHCVYENDVFRMDLAANDISHSFDLKSPRGLLIGVYAVARYREGTPQVEVMSVADVEAVRKRSRAANDGPWVTDFAEMARKTVVRRLAKYLPLSVELAKAFEIDDEEFHEEPPANDTSPPAQEPAAVRTARQTKQLAARVAERAGAAPVIDADFEPSPDETSESEPEQAPEPAAAAPPPAAEKPKRGPKPKTPAQPAPAPTPAPPPAPSKVQSAPSPAPEPEPEPEPEEPEEEEGEEPEDDIPRGPDPEAPPAAAAHPAACAGLTPQEESRRGRLVALALSEKLITMAEAASPSAFSTLCKRAPEGWFAKHNRGI